MKKVSIFLIFFFFALAQCMGQAYSNVNQLRFLAITKAADTAQVMANQGRVWYDFASDKFRGNINGVNVTIAPAGATGLTGADNGLSVSGSDVVLGGTLDGTTTILTGENNLIISREDLETSVNASNPIFGIYGDPFNTVAAIGNLYNSSAPTHSSQTVWVATATESRTDNYFVNNSVTAIHSSTFNGTSIEENYDTGVTTNATGAINSVATSSISMNSGDAFNLQSTNSFGIIAGGDLSISRISGGGITANTSTGLNLFAASGLTVRSTSRHTFTATSTLPGINVGSFAGDPSSLTNGDIWYNSSTGNLRARIGGSSVSIGTVSSVGMVAGTSGSDVNISGSPITSSGNITINIPDASASARGLVTTGAQTFAGTKTFTPTGTNAGLNVGSFAGDPSSINNGDIWYNSSLSLLRTRIGSTANIVSTTSGASSSRVAFWTGSAQLSGDGNFSFDGATDALSVSRVLLTPSATLAGLNVGSFGGNPSTLANGDVWYNSSTNALSSYISGVSRTLANFTSGSLPASGQVFYSSGSNTGLIGAEAAFSYDASTNLLTADNLRIAALTNDDTETRVLVAESDGDIQYRNVSSIAGVPAGSNTQIQYNNSGAFGAESDFVYNATNNTMTMGAPLSNTGIIFGAAGGADSYITLYRSGASVFGMETSGSDGVLRAEAALDIFADGDITIENTVLTPSNGLVLNVNRIYMDVAASNPIFGTATLGLGGTATVVTNKVTANSIILLTVQDGIGNEGAVRVGSKTPGGGFTIVSTENLDQSVVAWWIIEAN